MNICEIQKGYNGNKIQFKGIEDYTELGLSGAKAGDTDIISLAEPIVRVKMSDTFGSLIDGDAGNKYLLIGCIGIGKEGGEDVYIYPEFNPTSTTDCKFMKKNSAGGNLIPLQFGGYSSDELSKFNQIGGTKLIDDISPSKIAKFLTQEQINTFKFANLDDDDDDGDWTVEVPTISSPYEKLVQKIILEFKNYIEFKSEEEYKKDDILIDIIDLNATATKIIALKTFKEKGDLSKALKKQFTKITLAMTTNILWAIKKGDTDYLKPILNNLIKSLL